MENNPPRPRINPFLQAVENRQSGQNPPASNRPINPIQNQKNQNLHLQQNRLNIESREANPRIIFNLPQNNLAGQSQRAKQNVNVFIPNINPPALNQQPTVQIQRAPEQIDSFLKIKRSMEIYFQNLVFPEKFEKKIKINNRNQEIQILLSEQIPIQLNEKIGRKWISKKGKEQITMDFVKNINFTHPNATISKKNSEFYDRSIKNRLRFNLHFYNHQQTLETIFNEYNCLFETFIRGKIYEPLIQKICNFTNPLCAYYAFTNVMFYRHGIPHENIFDPERNRFQPSYLQQKDVQLDCYEFLLADINEFLNIFSAKTKQKLLKIPNILQDENFIDQINTVMNPKYYSIFEYALDTQNLGMNQELLSHQVILFLRKVAQIAKSLLKHLEQSFDSTQIEHQKEKIYNQCIKFLEHHQQKFSIFKNVQKIAHRLKNELIEVKVPQLIRQVIDEKGSKDLKPYGDWGNLAIFVFSHHSKQRFSVNIREQYLLQVYQSIENIQKIKAENWIKGILSKIDNFIESLKKKTNQVAVNRRDTLIFLILCGIVSKIYFSKTFIEEEWYMCYTNISKFLIDKANQKMEKMRQINLKFNQLLHTFHQHRKDLTPIVMLGLLEVKDLKYLEVKTDFMSSLVKPLILNENLDTYFENAKFLLHRNLFGDYNYSKISKDDSLYLDCIKNLVERKIGKIKVQNSKFIIDIEKIFICWANNILQEISARFKGPNLPEIGKNIQTLLNKLESKRQQIEKQQILKKLTAIKIEDLLLKQFEELKDKKKLKPFYANLKKENSRIQNDFYLMMGRFPIRIRQKLLSCLTYKLQNRLMRVHVKTQDFPKNDDILQSLETQNPYKSFCQFIVGIPGHHFINFIWQIREFYEKQQKKTSQNKDINQWKSSESYFEQQSNRRCIEPFNLNHLDDLIKENYYDQYLGLIDRLTIFKKIWNEILKSEIFPVKIVQENKIVGFYFPSQKKLDSPQITRKQAQTFSEKLASALEIANQAISESILLFEKNIDQKTSLNGLDNVETVLTHNLNVNHHVETLVDLMIHMRKVEFEEKMDKKPKKILSNIPKPRTTEPYNKMLDSAIFTPSLLITIAEYIRLKMTLQKTRLQISRIALVNLSILNEAQITQNQTKMKIQLVDLSQLLKISQKLLVLVGDMIKLQYKQKTSEINVLLILTIFFTVEFVGLNKLKLRMISVLARLNPTIDNLTKIFNENHKLLKMHRYLQFCHNFSGQSVIDPQTKKSFLVRTQEPVLQQAIGLFLKKVQRQLFEIANQYLPMLYNQFSEPQEDEFLDSFKLSANDVLYITSILKCTMTVVQNRHELYKDKRQVLDAQKYHFLIKLLVVDTNIIEICYQKLLQIVTFERPCLSHTNLSEDDWNDYEYLVQTIRQFNRFVKHLSINEYSHEFKQDHSSVFKCLCYLNEVIEHCELEAGRKYRQLYDPHEKKVKPNLEIYNFLADEPKQKKIPRHEIYKKETQIDFDNPLVIGRKFKLGIDEESQRIQ